MKLPRTALSLALSAALLTAFSACSEDDPGDPEASSPTTVTETVKKTKPSESTTKRSPKPTQKNREPREDKPSSSKKECGKLSARQALEQNIHKLPPPEHISQDWNTEFAGVDLYDPCADLSPIVVTIDMATASSPYHILLFNKGEFLGTATAEAQAFSPIVEQANDQTVAVTYRYPKPGEPNAAPTGETHATFTWDEAQGKVVMEGDLPPRG